MKIGVLSDTHVPDRARRLDPRILDIFQDSGVGAILHAGDICTQVVLDQLGRVAPVHAVRGNRDIWRLAHLPLKMKLKFEGVEIGLTHGHDGFTGYISQKLSYFIKGYQLKRFQQRLRKTFPSAKVLVFGHTHRSENTWVKDILVFNPGPASALQWGRRAPSLGLLHIGNSGEVSGEIIPLD